EPHDRRLHEDRPAGPPTAASGRQPHPVLAAAAARVDAARPAAERHDPVGDELDRAAAAAADTPAAAAAPPAPAPAAQLRDHVVAAELAGVAGQGAPAGGSALAARAAVAAAAAAGGRGRAHVAGRAAALGRRGLRRAAGPPAGAGRGPGAVAPGV